MQANTTQARTLLRAAIKRSIKNFNANVQILHTYTDNKGTTVAKRYVMFVLSANTVAQLYDVLDYAHYLFANEGNNYSNKITLNIKKGNAAIAYLRCVANIA